jgi:hypothetical protein
LWSGTGLRTGTCGCSSFSVTLLVNCFKCCLWVHIEHCDVLMLIAWGAMTTFDIMCCCLLPNEMISSAFAHTLPTQHPYSDLVLVSRHLWTISNDMSSRWALWWGYVSSFDILGWYDVLWFAWPCSRAQSQRTLERICSFYRCLVHYIHIEDDQHLTFLYSTRWYPLLEP